MPGDLRRYGEGIFAILLTTPEPEGGKFVDLAVQLTAIWERLLKTAPVGLDEDFFEKGGDSLLAMDMLAELDKLAGEAIPASILLDAQDSPTGAEADRTK